jgi:hypothetical protein
MAAILRVLFLFRRQFFIIRNLPVPYWRCNLVIASCR